MTSLILSVWLIVQTVTLHVAEHHHPVPVVQSVDPGRRVVAGAVESHPWPNWQPGDGVEYWRPIVAQHFKPSDVEWALAIMLCESGGKPDAKNPDSTASGLFQFLRGTWEWVRPHTGVGSFDSGAAFDPVSNVEQAAHLLYMDGGGKQHWQCSA